MAGRPPIPTALKIMRGNPGKRPLNDREPKRAALEEVPRAPARVKDPVARKKWRETAAILIAMRVLTDADLSALARYCNAYAMNLVAERDIALTGQTCAGENGSYINPSVNIWMAMSKIEAAFETKFGMTPSDRAKIKIGDDKKEDPNEAKFFGPRPVR